MRKESFTSNGTSYTLTELTAGDYDDCKVFFQYLPYHKLYRTRKSFPPEVIDKKLDAVFDKCLDRKITAADMESITDADGSAYMLYLSLRRAHPELTKEAVFDLADSMSPEVGADVARKLRIVNGWRAAEVSTEADSKKKKVKAGKNS